MIRLQEVVGDGDDDEFELHVHLHLLSLHGVLHGYLFVRGMLVYLISKMLLLHDECLGNLVLLLQEHTKNSTEHFMHGKSMRRRIRNDHVIVEMSQMFVSRRLSDRYRCRVIISK